MVYKTTLLTPISILESPQDHPHSDNLLEGPTELTETRCNHSSVSVQGKAMSGEGRAVQWTSEGGASGGWGKYLLILLLLLEHSRAHSFKYCLWRI